MMRAWLQAQLTYANVVATLALFIALGGVSYAAVKLPARSVGTKQLKTDAVTSDKVRDGTLRKRDFKRSDLPAGDTGQDGHPGDAGPPGPRGEHGAPGDGGPPGSRGEHGALGEKGDRGDDGTDGGPGTAGAAGDRGPIGLTGSPGQPGPPGPSGPGGPPGVPGPTGIVATHRISGLVGTIAPEPDSFQFLGAQATVTTTSAQRLTGSAMVPLAVSGAPATIWLDLCHQPSSGGALTAFSGVKFSVVTVTATRTAQAVAGTTVPGAGTWKVGACAQTTVTLDNNNFVNGYVQVTN